MLDWYEASWILFEMYCAISDTLNKIIDVKIKIDIASMTQDMKHIKTYLAELLVMKENVQYDTIKVKSVYDDNDSINVKTNDTIKQVLEEIKWKESRKHVIAIVATLQKFVLEWIVS